MRHLCRIKQEIGWKQQGVIICMDYQATVLRCYFGEGVKVRELNTKKIMGFPDDRRGRVADRLCQEVQDVQSI